MALDESTLPTDTAAATALLAVCRVRQALSNWPAGEELEPAVLVACLEYPLPKPELEAERPFARGWLRWLAGDYLGAEPLLAEARQRLQEAGADQTEAAYWLARVRLLLHRPEALVDFESALRLRTTPPRGTAWFVDLLWRAGQPERAEQVWKTVRVNRKVLASDETPLLEARALLYRGDILQAERVLNEARPRCGPVQAECRLLLAWTLAAQDHKEQAADLLRQRVGIYPATVVETWRTLLSACPPLFVGQALAAPAALGPWLQGQRARLAKRPEEAASAYRASLSSPTVQHFARYGLACLGFEDFSALLAVQPGWFLALRCRARLALPRFFQRQTPPAELLDQLARAAALGYRTPATEHAWTLATLLGHKAPSAEELRRFVGAASAPGEFFYRNCLQMAVETALRTLPRATALDLLLDWACREPLPESVSFRSWLGTQVLRLLLLVKSESCPDLDSTLTPLLGQDPRLALAQAWLNPGRSELPGAVETTDNLARLWRAARALAAGQPLTEEWRREVGEGRSRMRLRGLAQVLLLQEAAQRNDLSALVPLLEDQVAWQSFGAGPPHLVTHTLARVVGCHAVPPRLRRALATWLSCWDASCLGLEAQRLALHAGLVPLDPSSAEPPTGVLASPWLLYQAAQALRQERWGEALQWSRRAQAHSATDQDHAALLTTALPALARLAQAETLAQIVRMDPAQPAVAAGLLSDMLESLESEAIGRAALAAAEAGDLPTARQHLAVLSQQQGLGPRVAHHLALMWYRAALFFEGVERTSAALPCWALAWRCWLPLLSSLLCSASMDKAELLLEHLLGHQRWRLGALLNRGEMEQARKHWELIHALPAWARAAGAALGETVDKATARLRDELATEQLLHMRQAAQHGKVPAGWRADYPAALDGLRRLLSLDHDNLRLLTALVELCAEWFLDCYNNENPRQLWEGLDRFTPFALKLARLVGDKPEELAARAAVAEFYKFRGLLAANDAHRKALYGEALKFNPANDNVRTLLARLEPEQP